MQQQQEGSITFLKSPQQQQGASSTCSAFSHSSRPARRESRRSWRPSTRQASTTLATSGACSIRSCTRTRLVWTHASAWLAGWLAGLGGDIWMEDGGNSLGLPAGSA